MIKQEHKYLAKTFAKRLGESAEAPVRQIANLIAHLGEEHVGKKVDEALAIDAGDGMMTLDGSRRRTPGGIFFYIIKEGMSEEDRRKIFPGYGQGARGKIIDFEERVKKLSTLVEEPGPMRYVSILLNGKAGKVEIFDNSVMMVMTHVHNDAPYPRGVPDPPDIETRYFVFMGMKHWEPVSKSLKKNPRDTILVEGTCIFDAELEAITVFATNVKTKMMEKQFRRAARMGDLPPGQSAKKKRKKKKQAAQKDSPPPAKKKTEAKADAPAKPAPEPEVAVADVPAGAPPDVVEKLQQLESAAQTLRERIAAKVAKGQRATLEEKLLANTERQYESLKKKYE